MANICKDHEMSTQQIGSYHTYFLSFRYMQYELPWRIILSYISFISIPGSWCHSLSGTQSSGSGCHRFGRCSHGHGKVSVPGTPTSGLRHCRGHNQVSGLRSGPRWPLCFEFSLQICACWFLRARFPYLTHYKPIHFSQDLLQELHLFTMSTRV